MVEKFFVMVNQWMTTGTAIAGIGCFLWGMVSVMLSPCHLASIPLIVAYVGGQERAIEPKRAAIYSAVFTTGLFVTIAMIGIICSLLGRMLGDVGPYWQILIGLILFWVALDMFGVKIFSTSYRPFYLLKLRGILGAFALGLCYGLLSGLCTFGFIAPVLAIVTVQKKIAMGVFLIILFAVGHCFPIALAGSFAAAVRKLMENRKWQVAEKWFQKGAGVIICMLGFYFIAGPFVF